MRRDVRLLTAVVLIGICGFSVARGLGLVHFSLALARIDSSERREEIVNRWSSAPDVASRALQVDLAYQIDPSDQRAVNRRRQTLTELVSIKPMSSYHWLSLSGLQFISDQPMEQVFDSLELSMLTGPNESRVMGERAVFAVSLWERLPSDLKSHVASDVAGMMMFSRTPEEGAEVGKLQAVLARQPEWVRNELREAVVATGFSPKEIEQRLRF
jgi:hypothetical protein